jgi:hypothetical protein
MNKLFAAFILLTFCACKEVSFKEPQPKGRKALSEIPKELRGTYLVEEENSTNKDTMLVTSRGYFVRSDSTKGELGDSLVLKKYKGYYFFNDNENPEWLLRLIKKEANGDLSYLLMEPGKESFNEFLLKLNEEIEIDSSEVSDEKLYQIDPSPKELMSLIEKGYFKKKMKLKKLN